MMKKVIKKRIWNAIVAYALVAATIVGYAAAVPVKVQAGFLEYKLNHDADPNAPDVEVGCLRTIFGMSGKVNQYDIRPGKYYVMKKAGRCKQPLFSFRLVKVTDVYEDPTWYGSERTVEIIYCDTGARAKVCPNKGMKPPQFYEISRFQ